jgi:hypothetical protein
MIHLAIFFWFRLSKESEQTDGTSKHNSPNIT